MGGGKKEEKENWCSRVSPVPWGGCGAPSFWLKSLVLFRCALEGVLGEQVWSTRLSGLAAEHDRSTVYTCGPRPCRLNAQDWSTECEK